MEKLVPVLCKDPRSEKVWVTYTLVQTINNHYTTHPTLKQSLGYIKYITQCEQHLELLTSSIQGNIERKNICSWSGLTQLQIFLNAVKLNNRCKIVPWVSAVFMCWSFQICPLIYFNSCFVWLYLLLQCSE